MDTAPRYDELHDGAAPESTKSALVDRLAARRNWTLVQLEPGPLLTASTIRRFDGLRVQQIAVNRTVLHRIRAPAGSVSLLGSSLHSGAQFVDGYELERDCYLVLDAGAQLELVAHSGSSAILISLFSACVNDAPPSRPALLLHPGVRLIKRSMSVCLSLQQEVARLLSRIGSDSAASRTRASAKNVLRDSVDLTADAAALSAMRDDRARRRLAVERARSYIWKHLTDPIRLCDLCGYAHLQARSLEYGFRELVGLSPMGYVRMLRLGEVRARLLEVAAPRRSISEIALDAGFTHLSQFVVDYKKVFGETPSTTRRKTLSSFRLDSGSSNRSTHRAWVRRQGLALSHA